MLISSPRDFEQNFLSAWRQRTSNLQGVRDDASANESVANRPGDLPVFLENEQLKIPILNDDITPEELLTDIRMFYKYLKFKRGLVELVVPRELVQINCVCLLF